MSIVYDRYQFCADMAELVDATDLKSVGTCSRAGSIPAFRTTFKLTLCLQRVFFMFCFRIFFLPVRAARQIARQRYFTH